MPQGSKLGPILYIMYAYDMLNSLNNSQTYTYADDTAIVVASESIQDTTEIMQNQLNIASKWYHDNGLIINVQKTLKPQHFTDSNIVIKFHDMNCLHNINSNKYLGVYVDNIYTI